MQLSPNRGSTDSRALQDCCSRRRWEKNNTKKILLNILKMENIALNGDVLFFLVYLLC